MAEQGITRWQHHWPGHNPAWPQQLIRLGLAAELIEPSIHTAQVLIEQILADPFLQHRLNKPERCQAEHTWVHTNGQGFTPIRPDLLWLSDEGETWLIDYKTATPPAGVTRAAFIEQEKTTYQTTMAEYAQALTAAGVQRLRVGLYFVGLGVWEEYGVF
jgi:hypothetical protein